jgi:hypothetical protein
MSDLADRVHRSPAWLNQRFGLLKLAPQVQALVDESKINVLSAVVLSKLPHDEQLNYIDQAMTLTTAEFGPVVNKRLSELRKAARLGKEAEPEKFEPVVKVRKKTELESELKNPANLFALVSDTDSVEDAAVLVLKWVLNVDPQSSSLQEATWNQRKARIEEEKRLRAVERADKKAAEAAEAAKKARSEAESSEG